MRFLRLHHALIPLLALLTIAPLIIHGCSCGHDQPFHMQSWLDAAQQLRHGTLYPRWAFSPAWQAGEPRFVFYPPLSWMLGAVLTMLFPMNAVPVIFTWIALTGAGFSMHLLARRFAGTTASLVCAGVYMANPYMLFNAFERGAYAELLAAVWIPLVLLSVLEDQISVAAIALPLGLVWVTNAPAAVMATYTLVLLGAARLAMTYRATRAQHAPWRQAVPTLMSLAAGMALGLALVCFYLLPAAYERRYVQVAMAIIPNLRYQDNFLFSKTDYLPHNEITFAVSVLALLLLLATLAAVLFAFFRTQSAGADDAAPVRFPRQVAAQLLLLTCAVGFLLTPASSFVWEHLPNLKYLQFPWRLCTILAAVFALALAPLAARWSAHRWICVAVTFAIVFGLSQIASRLYRQGCEAHDYPAFEAAAFQSGHGVLPTDEYTPGDADNDIQRTDNPGYWLVRDNPNEPAPGTIANPNETIVNYDGPIPFENTLATRAPHNLQLTLPAPGILVLNLRDYPSWRVTRNGAETPTKMQRNDGLIALALPAGSSSIDVGWHRSWDENAGAAISLCALPLLGFALSRSRKMKAQAR